MPDILDEVSKFLEQSDKFREWDEKRLASALDILRRLEDRLEFFRHRRRRAIMERIKGVKHVSSDRVATIFDSD